MIHKREVVLIKGQTPELSPNNGHTTMTTINNQEKIKDKETFHQELVMLVKIHYKR